MDDSYSNRLWSDSMALVETPLILSANSHYNHHFNTALYPYNLSAFQGGSGSSNSNTGGVNGYSYQEHINGSGGGSSGGVDNIFIDTDGDENGIFDKHPTGELSALDRLHPLTQLLAHLCARIGSGIGNNDGKTCVDYNIV